jgi:hypothetical protein
MVTADCLYRLLGPKQFRQPCCEVVANVGESANCTAGKIRATFAVASSPATSRQSCLPNVLRMLPTVSTKSLIGAAHI